MSERQPEEYVYVAGTGVPATAGGAFALDHAGLIVAWSDGLKVAYLVPTFSSGPAAVARDAHRTILNLADPGDDWSISGIKFGLVETKTTSGIISEDATYVVGVTNTEMVNDRGHNGIYETLVTKLMIVPPYTNNLMWLPINYSGFFEPAYLGGAPLAFQPAPAAMALDTDSDTLYFADVEEYRIRIVDLGSGNEITTMPAWTVLTSMIANHGSNIYCIGQKVLPPVPPAPETVQGPVYLMRLPDGAEVGTLADLEYIQAFDGGVSRPLDPRAGLTISPDGKMLIVTLPARDLVQAYDTDGLQLQWQADVAGAFAAAYSVDGERVYVNKFAPLVTDDYPTLTLTTLDATSGAILNAVSYTGQPRFISAMPGLVATGLAADPFVNQALLLDPFGGELLVANEQADLAISYIQPAKKRHLSTVGIFDTALQGGALATAVKRATIPGYKSPSAYFVGGASSNVIGICAVSRYTLEWAIFRSSDGGNNWTREATVWDSDYSCAVAAGDGFGMEITAAVSRSTKQIFFKRSKPDGTFTDPVVVGTLTFATTLTLRQRIEVGSSDLVIYAGPTRKFESADGGISWTETT